MVWGFDAGLTLDQVDEAFSLRGRQLDTLRIGDMDLSGRVKQVLARLQRFDEEKVQLVKADLDLKQDDSGEAGSVQLEPQD